MINWKLEGQDAAFHALYNADKEPLECPWPMYTPEGREWFRGWNEIANQPESKISFRPANSGWMFEPDAA